LKKIALLLVLILVLFSTCGTGENYNIGFQTPEGDILVSFSVTCDMRDYTGCNVNYFRGACETIASGGRGDFMVSPGDIDPPEKVYSTISTYIGEDYTWYPVVGNHDTASIYMDWLRNYIGGENLLPNIDNWGPSGCEKTTYSFDYANAHFVVLNEYYDGENATGTDGDVVDALYTWLENDLQNNQNSLIFVFGHEPAYPKPDAESERVRHKGDSLDKYPANRDRFWNTLKKYSVIAYICGHTHNYSAVNIDGVWQIDAGHARGTADTGARSTFIMFYITAQNEVWYYTYRLDLDIKKYALTESKRIVPYP